MSTFNREVRDAADTLLSREAVLEAHPPEKTVNRPGGKSWTRRRGQVAPQVLVRRDDARQRVLVTHTHRLDLALALARWRYPELTLGEPQALWMRRHIGSVGPTGAPGFEETHGDLPASFPVVAVPW